METSSAANRPSNDDAPDSEHDNHLQTSSTAPRSIPPVSETAVGENTKIESLWEQLKKTTQADIQKKRKKTSSNWNSAQFISEVTNQEAQDDKTGGAALQMITASAKAPSSGPKEEPTGEPEEEMDRRVKKRTRSSGVDALLSTLQKKKKATVLDSSKKEWRAFKASHKNDAEELDAHQKSAEQFLEKQQFLSQAAQNEHRNEVKRKHKAPGPPHQNRASPM